MVNVSSEDGPQPATSTAVKERWSSGRSLLVLALLLVACYAVAALGGIATGPNIRSWYAYLVKPPWTPPNWLFGPVWSLLYTLMGLSAWLVWLSGAPTRRRPLLVFALHLVLNLAWSWLFFGWHLLLLALIEIVLLWAAIAWTTLEFRRVSPRAAWLLVPYLAWVAYAATLNAGIWWLNR